MVESTIVAADANAAPVKRIAATTMPIDAKPSGTQYERNAEWSPVILGPQLAGALCAIADTLGKEPSPATNCQRGTTRRLHDLCAIGVCGVRTVEVVDHAGGLAGHCSTCPAKAYWISSLTIRPLFTFRCASACCS